MSIRVFIPVLLAAAVSMSGRAAAPVSPQEAERLIAEAQTVMQRFHSQTVAARLAFLCLDRFQSPEQKQQLNRQAAGDYGELLGLLNQQKRRLDEIEAYEGDDWEELYGESRLWARLDQSVRLSECQLNRILFWKILSGEKDLEVATLDQLIEKQMAAGSPWKDRDDALRLSREFGKPGPAARNAALFGEKIRNKSDCEWCLVYAFVDFRGGRGRSLKALSDAWPEMTPFLSRLVLDRLHERFEKDGPRILETQDGFALSLACRAAGDDPRSEAYLAFLKAASAVCREPAVELALSRALASSYPSNALFYACRVVELAFEKPLPSDENRQIADQAVRLALRLCEHGSIKDFRPVLQMLDRYFSCVQEGVDPEIVLAAADIYAAQQQPEAAKERLGRLLEENPAFAGEVRRRLTLIDLDDLLAGPLKCDELLPRAALILAGLTDPVLRNDQIEKLSDMLEDYSWRYEIGAADGNLMDEAVAVSGACIRSGGRRAELLRVELSCQRGAVSDEEKALILALLDKNKGEKTPLFLRAFARRRMAEGDWSGALQAWGDLRLQLSGPASPRWWQCRYYELLCYSRLPETSYDELTRAVEVLLATYPAAPDDWKTRLRSLVPR